jgi:heavy metal translocating P-type ATPase
MAISYPRPGCLRLSNVRLFSTPEGEECRKFVSIIFQIPEVYEVEISASKASAEIRFDTNCTPQEFALKVGEQLSISQTDSQAIAIREFKTDWKGDAQIYRHETTVSTWKVASDFPGRIRLRNSRLFRKKKLCQDVERELMTVYGIQRFKVNSVTCSVLVYYDTNAIDNVQLIEFLEKTLQTAEEHPHVEKNNHELLICTVALGLSAIAQFAFPVLLVPASSLFFYCAYPTFIGARNTLFKERRLGVDVLDAIVVVMCLASGEIFAGAVLTWCLSFGRNLLAKAQEDSRRRLINIFGKQARTAYLYQDGTEVSVSLDRIKSGDTIAVHTGEMIAVDGIVCNGAAVVDQHALTGESVPVDKEVGSKVYASTLVIGGKILVTVEKAGAETTSAKISAILNDTASFQLAAQSKGEELADKAVIPTLGLAAAGFWHVGMHGATAIVNCDFGTGIRMAAPLALLSSLSVCSNRGILIKDGRALEQMDSIDTVLFDKTGTLTQERPTVHRIHKFGRLGEKRILTFAAAAEHRLDHPIAKAIVEKFHSLAIPLPVTDQSSYKAGYGISVKVEDKRIRVGSSRFMKLQRVAIPKEAVAIEQEVHIEGHSIVFVAVDKTVVGAIELAPTLRSGVRELIAGLRERGISQIVIISGDHEKPTRKLANELGVDRYFAEVLPTEKADYVELLQKDGRKVCFVGDGINDSIALKRANVSVSLRGATSVATDTAQLVFMEDNLWKLCEFIDISQELDRNIKTSWVLILVPNLLCIAGAFFFGFGVMASVLANNVAAIGALANGLRPLKMYPATHTSLVPKRQNSWLAKLSRLASSLFKIAAKKLVPTKQVAIVPYEAESLTQMLTGGRGISKNTLLFLSAGVVGIATPGIPGWALVRISITLLSSRVPVLGPFDQWLGRRFPNAHLNALNFAFRFFMDIQKRFPGNPQGNGGASHHSIR